MKKPRLISLEQFQYITLIIFAFMMIGLGKLISARFRWDVFLDATVWTSILSSLTAHVAIIMGGHKWKVYNENRDNLEIIDKKKIIKTFSIKDKDTDFYSYIRGLDTQNKKEAWVSKIQRKIDKLEMKGKSKRANRLQRLLKDEYIDSRINILNVRYKEIKVKMIVNGSERVDEDEGLVSGAKFIFDYLAPKILITLGASIFSNTIIPVFQQPDATTLYTFLYEAVILLLSFIWGTSLATAYIDGVVITNLDYRIDIIRRYLNSKKVT